MHSIGFKWENSILWQCKQINNNDDIFERHMPSLLLNDFIPIGSKWIDWMCRIEENVLKTKSFRRDVHIHMTLKTIEIRLNASFLISLFYLFIFLSFVNSIVRIKSFNRPIRLLAKKIFKQKLKHNQIYF